jgi:single-stranded-DNA-specific exonuclease
VKHKIETLTTLGSVIVMGSREWRPSLLGIAATSVVQTYQRPVCLWGMDGDLIKGSCRSDGTVNIVDLLVEAKDAFLDFGGHELSGGFSVDPASIHTLPEQLEAAHQRLMEKNAGNEVEVVDLENIESHLNLTEVNDLAYEALRTLAPFGQQNPKPVFRLKGVTAYAITYFGAGKEHARITLTDDSGARADAIAFFFPRTTFKDTLALLSDGDTCTVDACIERSYFAGRRELRLRIENLVL